MNPHNLIQVDFIGKRGGMLQAWCGDYQATSACGAQFAAQAVALKIAYGLKPPYPRWEKSGLSVTKVSEKGWKSVWRMEWPGLQFRLAPITTDACTPPAGPPEGGTPNPEAAL